jgi:hypothetical protein
METLEAVLKEEGRGGYGHTGEGEGPEITKGVEGKYCKSARVQLGTKWMTILRS